MNNLIRRQQIQGLETERKCWRLYIEQGKTMPEIAAELSITKGAVSRAIQRTEKRLEAAQVASADKHRAVMLGELWQLYRDAREAFRKSIGEHKKNRTKVTKGKDTGDVTQAEIASENKYGDPRWAAEARLCLDRICKLKGLDAPTKVQNVDPDRPYEGLTDDELRREFLETLRSVGIDPADLADAEISRQETTH
jgi:predicted DNA-binding protein YlxM (UPF0122 family)